MIGVCFLSTPDDCQYVFEWPLARSEDTEGDQGVTHAAVSFPKRLILTSSVLGGRITTPPDNISDLDNHPLGETPNRWLDPAVIGKSLR